MFIEIGKQIFSNFYFLLFEKKMGIPPLFSVWIGWPWSGWGFISLVCSLSSLVELWTTFSLAIGVDDVVPLPISKGVDFRVILDECLDLSIPLDSSYCDTVALGNHKSLCIPVWYHSSKFWFFSLRYWGMGVFSLILTIYVPFSSCSSWSASGFIISVIGDRTRP